MYLELRIVLLHKHPGLEAVLYTDLDSGIQSSARIVAARFAHKWNAS